MKVNGVGCLFFVWGLFFFFLFDDTYFCELIILWGKIKRMHMLFVWASLNQSQLKSEYIIVRVQLSSLSAVHMHFRSSWLGGSLSRISRSSKVWGTILLILNHRIFWVGGDPLGLRPILSSAQSTSCAWECCPNGFWTLAGLVPQPVSWGAWSLSFLRHLFLQTAQTTVLSCKLTICVWWIGAGLGKTSLCYCAHLEKHGAFYRAVELRLCRKLSFVLIPKLGLWSRVNRRLILQWWCDIILFSWIWSLIVYKQVRLIVSTSGWFSDGMSNSCDFSQDKILSWTSVGIFYLRIVLQEMPCYLME